MRNVCPEAGLKGLRSFWYRLLVEFIDTKGPSENAISLYDDREPPSMKACVVPTGLNLGEQFYTIID